MWMLLLIIFSNIYVICSGQHFRNLHIEITLHRKSLMIQSGLCLFATVLYASHATYWVFLVFCLAILVCMLCGAYQVWRSTDGQGLRQSDRLIACLEQVLLPCSLIFPILFCLLVAYYFLHTEPEEDEEESEEALNDAEMVTDESDTDSDEDGDDEFEEDDDVPDVTEDEKVDESEEDDDEPDVTEDEEVDESEEVKLGEKIDESKKDNQPSEGENPTE